VSSRSEPLVGLAALSARERTIALSYARGLTHRQIGGSLCIAPTTVRTHLANIFAKLDVHNRTALGALIAASADKGSTSDDSGPPVVAVMPFDLVEPDPRSTRLVDGLHAEVITDLARHPDLLVIGRHTMLAYRGRAIDLRTVGREVGAGFVVEGTIQWGNDRVRVTAQLIDASNGAALWSARYDRAGDELFAARDEISRSVVNAIGGWTGRLALLRRELARRKPPGSLAAYELYLLGLEQKHTFTDAGNAEAIRLLGRALELDPGYARAWTVLGLCHAVAIINAFTERFAAGASQWRICTEKALALDPNDPIAHASMGDLLAHEGDLAGARGSYERALEVAPGNADTLAFLAGSFSLVSGDPRRGLELARQAIRLNPGAPPWYFGMLGRATYVAGETAECVAALHRAHRAAPNILLLEAMAQARLGEHAEATRILARLERDFPRFGLAVLIREYPVTNPPALAALREDAERLGLPWPRRAGR
jgi:TolB-like protein